MKRFQSVIRAFSKRFQSTEYIELVVNGVLDTPIQSPWALWIGTRTPRYVSRSQASQYSTFIAVHNCGSQESVEKLSWKEEKEISFGVAMQPDFIRFYLPRGIMSIKTICIALFLFHGVNRSSPSGM